MTRDDMDPRVEYERLMTRRHFFGRVTTGIGVAALAQLLGEGTLFNVLAYHVTEGRRFSNSVFNRNSTKMVEMLNGQYIVTNPDLTINDIAGQSVGVVPSLVNINASNGVIHVIGTVLLPF